MTAPGRIGFVACVICVIKDFGDVINDTLHSHFGCLVNVFKYHQKKQTASNKHQTSRKNTKNNTHTKKIILL